MPVGILDPIAAVSNFLHGSVEIQGFRMSPFGGGSENPFSTRAGVWTTPASATGDWTSAWAAWKRLQTCGAESHETLRDDLVR